MILNVNNLLSNLKPNKELFKTSLKRANNSDLLYIASTIQDKIDNINDKLLDIDGGYESVKYKDELLKKRERLFIQLKGTIEQIKYK
jgi:hypothetical protein